MHNPLPPLLLRGDCLDKLKLIDSDIIDAIVTDPPYGLSATDPAHVVDTLTRWASGDRGYTPEGKGFMGKAWDAFVPPPAVWDECMRVLKPGGHLLAFAGARTFDLMTLSIRFAGFDIRDAIAWLYGSGFPKSRSIDKDIDRMAGAVRERKPLISGGMSSGTHNGWNSGDNPHSETAPLAGTVADDKPLTDAASQWLGWGTALKPAFEPIVVARKPFPGTVAANVLAHGTGALNIDATRVGNDTSRGDRYAGKAPGGSHSMQIAGTRDEAWTVPAGRWPANVMLDESQAAALDAQSGYMKDGVAVKRNRDGKPQGTSSWSLPGAARDDAGYGGGGGASRFFYVAPIDELQERFIYAPKAPQNERPKVDGVAHPTVKSLRVMRYLCKLVTPPGGVILDPFAGSGATLEAAYLEAFESIGVELTPDYWPLIEARIERVTK